MFEGIHHIAIIAGDYERSKLFYTEIMGFEIVREVYRQERESYKLDLSLKGHYIMELFSFQGALPRPSMPEAQGLRHLAFGVSDLDKTISMLSAKGVKLELVRTDPYTEKRFTFFSDPDGLPLELYEI